MAEKQKKTKGSNKYLKWFWMLFLAGIFGIISIVALANWGVFGEMSIFEELENPSSSVSTEIISADGRTLGKFYLENHVPVKYEDLPPHLVQALIATEDERFHSHSGIAAKGTLRAVTSLGSSGGATTITQQLAKNLCHGSSGSNEIVKRMTQKNTERIIATRLERQSHN